jgi:hypothetical protein
MPVDREGDCFRLVNCLSRAQVRRIYASTTLFIATLRMLGHTETYLLRFTIRAISGANSPTQFDIRPQPACVIIDW